MELSIVQIGNSKGIRLAKTVLEKYNFIDKVELILKDDFLILKPLKKVRAGWGEAFKEMAEKGEDELLIDDLFEDEEWE